MLRILQVNGEGVALPACCVVSHDGPHWRDRESRALKVRAQGLKSLAVHGTASWLRLRVDVPGQDPSVKALICLAPEEQEAR